MSISYIFFEKKNNNKFTFLYWKEILDCIFERIEKKYYINFSFL